MTAKAQYMQGVKDNIWFGVVAYSFERRHVWQFVHGVGVPWNVLRSAVESISFSAWHEGAVGKTENAVTAVTWIGEATVFQSEAIEPLRNTA